MQVSNKMLSPPRTTIKQPKHSRPITQIDEFYVQRNHWYVYPNYQISATYSIELTPQIIFSAITLLLNKYPQWSLQCFPSKSAHRKHEMRLLKEYNLGDVLMGNRSSENICFEDLVTSMINKRFELGCDKPLWNLIVYDKKTLVLYGDHLVGDGTSFRNFHTEFLKCLKEGTSGETVDGLSYTGLDSTIYRESQFATRDIYPAQNKIINYWVTTQYFAWCVLKYLIPPMFILYNMLRPKNKFEPKKENPFLVEESNQEMRREYHLKFFNVIYLSISECLPSLQSRETMTLRYPFLPISEEGSTIGKLTAYAITSQICLDYTWVKLKSMWIHCKTWESTKVSTGHLFPI
ncbi:unnamed protein product [Ambrosiozyma monospora]|uniref:Unnamed protein product n=1 Tax=Ambrosiozyma monospora TaxID=43982 RepID=A0A9W7DHV6_AMBMO|nr:unnamed protein product [Ambrosiozyma monospora]